MKAKYLLLLCLVLMFVQQVSSQPTGIPIYGSPITEENFISYKINLLEQSLNSKNFQMLNSLTTDQARTKPSMKKKERTRFSNTTKAKVKIHVNKVKIQGNTATVNCIFDFYSLEEISKNISTSLYLSKDGDWIFEDLGLLKEVAQSNNTITVQEKDSKTVNSLQLGQTLTIINTPPTIFSISDKTFIRIPCLVDADDGSPWAYVINSTLTMNYLGVKLFSQEAAIDVAHYIHDPDNDQSTTFSLDQQWGRVIYAKKGSNTLKSYGDHTGDTKFYSPIAIDVNEFGEIFVVDAYTSTVKKLLYNYSANTIQPASDFTIATGTLINPTDIDYNSYLTNDKSNDLIFIADPARGSVLKFDPSGNLLEEFKQFDMWGNKYDLVTPSRIASYGIRLAVIDDAQNLVVSGMHGLLDNTLVCSKVPAKLPPNSKPVDVGWDASTNIIVADENLNLLHKFDIQGSYMCSFPGITELLKSPQRVSNSVANNPGTLLLNYGVTEKWTSTDGMKMYLPAADAVNLQATEYQTYISFDCTLSDAEYYTLQLIRTSDNAIIESDEGETTQGGAKKTLLVDRSLLSSGTNYKWVVSFKPYWDDDYGSYAVGWQSRELNYPYQYPSGTITTNTTWSGKKYLAGSVTVSPEATLTISPGATIYFPSGASLNLNGKLIADGAPFLPITFTSISGTSPGSWGNITFNTPWSSSSLISYATVQYGSGISIQNASSITIQNSTIKNCSKGISVNSTGGNKIVSNKILNNSGDGLYCFSSTTTNFTNNDIANNSGYGIYVLSSSLYLGNGSTKGRNRIVNNGENEIRVEGNDSYLFAGYGTNSGGYNDIYATVLRSNKRYIYNYSQTYVNEQWVAITVYAEYNYWGSSGSPPVSEFYGPVQWNPFMSTSQSMGAGAGAPKVQVITMNNTLSVQTVLSARMVTAIAGEDSSGQEKVNLKQRMMNLRNKMQTCPDSLENGRWLLELYSLQKNLDPQDQLDEKQLIVALKDDRHNRLKGLYQDSQELKNAEKDILQGKKLATQLVGEVAMWIEINTLVEQKKYPEALVKIEEYGKQTKNLDAQRELLYQKLRIRIEQKDFSEALNVLADIKEFVKRSKIKGYRPPTFDQLESFLQEQAGMKMVKQEGNLAKEAPIAVVTKTDLIGNYPNPFNPSTIIKYQLVENSKVSLKAYDVAGREVATLVDGEVEMGNHSIAFNGSRFASGVYFIRFIAKGSDAKPFSKTMKMLLVK